MFILRKKRYLTYGAQHLLHYYGQIFLILLLTTNVMCKDNMRTQDYMLLLSNWLYKCTISDNKLSRQRVSINIDIKNMSEMYWPVYDEEKKILYYETSIYNYNKNKNSFVNEGIFYSRLSNNFDTLSTPQKLVDKGRFPALSPDKTKLAYYIHPNQLWIINLNSWKKEKIVDSVQPFQPVVWISEHKILYLSCKSELIIVDINNKKLINTNYQYVVPCMLSPKGKKVLCYSHGENCKSNSIKIYNVDTNKLECIKNFAFYSIGNSFVWSPDGKSFIFMRQTFFNLIQLVESQSLFKYSLDDNKMYTLLDRTSLSGGFPFYLKQPVVNNEQ